MRDALAHADALYNLARHLVGDPAEAEDLVQETFARGFAAIDGFADDNLKAWLFRILRNLFLDGQRRRVSRRTDGGLDTVDERHAAGDESDGVRAVAVGEIEAALAALPDDARLAILLDLEGFSAAEMADLIGCPLGTVKSRLFRARAALRDKLGVKP
jgi:RNA polymerase sigma-70 factor (ECF subfamily)